MNVSKDHPLKELAVLMAGLLAAVALLYAAVSVVSTWAVEHLPVEAELWLGKKMVKDIPGRPSPCLQKRLDALTRLLPDDSPLRRYRFEVYLADFPEANAVALPGGFIVVFRGLFDMIRSENELSMVLGHELGHYAHRDHLRRLGKGLALNAVLWLLFGRGNGSDKLVMPLISGLDARYSRKQEEAADAFGIELLFLRYGHVAGATDFFRTILKERRRPGLEYLFATHPHPRRRIERLLEMARERGWPSGRLAPLGEDLRQIVAEGSGHSGS